MFNGKRVFIIGTGASLTGFDFSRLDGEKKIAINHAYRLTPHDLHVFYDASFLEESRGVYNPATHTAKVLAGRNSNVREHENVQLFRRADHVTPSFQNGLYMGMSSALPAINAALIFGASEVFLLGIDCRFLTADEVAQAAKRNGNPKAAADVLNGAAFAHHVTQRDVRHTMATQDKERKYMQMAGQFNAFAGRPVYNLSPFSNLQLPYRSLDDVLKVGPEAEKPGQKTDIKSNQKKEKVK